MRKYLNEEIYLNSEDGITPNQKEYTIVYIDPDRSEPTFDIKDVLKQYNMEYLPSYKYFNRETKQELKSKHITWGWVIWNGDTDTTWQSIKKFEQDLPSIEKASGDTPRSAEDIHSSMPETVREILNSIQEIKDLPDKRGISKETQKRIDDFEEMLETELGNEKTQKFIESLIQYRAELHKHNMYNLGWTNMMLAYFATGGKATQVRPLGEWQEMGYELKDSPTPIGLIGKGCRRVRYSKEQKAKIISKYLKLKGVDSVEDLPQSSQYDLKHRVLAGKPIPGSEYNYTYIGYDITSVTPGENAEIEPEEPEDNWWWDKLPEDERDIALTTALIEFAESNECGNITVNVNNTQQGLDGARGNATSSGVINLINDGKMRFPTAVHELLHQLRHWAFASSNNPALKKFYYNHPNADTKEQEAELCASFVISNYGYDLQPHLNYLNNWGLNKKNCKAVFDKISEIATFIENGVKSHLQKEIK